MMQNPSSSGKSGEYIDHIDGLRFVAVTLVLLYHADMLGVSGGFIGVDIFFVISGFLITRIVLKMSLDRNGIVRFYTSRFRRIVPAYLALAATTGIVASFLFLPVHLDMLLPGLVSCIGFMSNIVFYRATSYFSPDPRVQPALAYVVACRRMAVLSALPVHLYHVSPSKDSRRDDARAYGGHVVCPLRCTARLL